MALESVLAFGPAVLVAALGCAAAGVVRGFAGFGAGMIYIPIAAAALSPRTAVGTLFVFDTIIILPLVFKSFSLVDLRELVPMGIGAVLMVPLGVWVLISTDPELLRWIISIFIVCAVSILYSGWRYRGPSRFSTSAAVGGVAGFLSGAAQLPAPPVVVYWMGRDLPARNVRANVIIFIMITTTAVFFAYTSSGVFTREVLVISGLFLPLYALAIFIGSRFFKVASDAVYRKVVYALILLVAVTTLPLFDRFLG